MLPAAVVGVLSAFGVIHRDDLERFFTGRVPLWLIGVVAAAVLLALPAAAALAAWRWVDSDARLRALKRLDIKRTHRVATSWDWAFDDEQDYLLVVTLKNGERVAGYYGEDSHSGYGTKIADLFLEERWDFTDDATQLAGPAPGNVGLYVPAEQIVAVERYLVSDGQREELVQRKR